MVCTIYHNDNGGRVGKVRLVGKKENARTFRPKNLPTQLSFATRRTLNCCPDYGVQFGEREGEKLEEIERPQSLGRWFFF